ncbi:MAG: hypothetical protein K0R75_1184, partial [Paenibacillaceae bacterium]|nr:hypothetical protein [Paenibacillaceae bacterium]
CVYMTLPYLNKQCDYYEQTYYRLWDLFAEYEWKLDILKEHTPVWEWEYIHARYSEDLKEIHTQNWGHAQHDMIGAFLFGVGNGLKVGKRMFRSDHDRQLLQKLVYYLQSVEYWHDPDNGMWEENREVHVSSVGACVAGLKSVEQVVHIPIGLIERGLEVVLNLFPRESDTKRTDLAQLSLIYPYRLFNGLLGEMLISDVESRLLRRRGVIRYEGDSYYSTKEAEFGRSHPPSFYAGSEAEWTFGLPWLALCHLELGNRERALDYIERTEAVMVAPGVLPELYYASMPKPNPNTPLGWSSAMYILAKEALPESSSRLRLA